MSLLYYLSEHRSGLGNLLSNITMELGAETALILLVCIILWTVNKYCGYQIGFAFFYSSIAVQTMKITFRVPRPWVAHPDFQPLESALETATGYSFPSGHTQTATAIWGSLAYYMNKKWQQMICFLLFLSVGFFRMYAGVHTPFDVCTAILTTIVVIVLVHRYITYEQMLLQDRALIHGGILAVLSLLSAAYCLGLVYQSTVPYELAQDTIKAAGAACGFGVGYVIERKYVDYSVEGSRRQKVFRVAIGILLLLACKVGLKPALGFLGMYGDFLRYFILILFAIVIYPILFMKFRNYSVG